jgi:hypothetical protein
MHVGKSSHYVIKLAYGLRHSKPIGFWTLLKLWKRDRSMMEHSWQGLQRLLKGNG